MLKKLSYLMVFLLGACAEDVTEEIATRVVFVPVQQRDVTIYANYMTGFESKNPNQNGAELFQSFLKDHYHKPSDTLYLPIDYDAGRVFTEITIDIGREVCNSPERPRWNAVTSSA